MYYSPVDVMTGLELETLARVGAALADGTRRAVLAQLVAGPKYPAQLATDLGVSRSSMSNHLACLRGCGLVAATYEGRQVRYDLADPVIGEALTALCQLPLGPCPEDAQR
jgi:DNA-binding transcriptional ArsR family regulator